MPGKRKRPEGADANVDVAAFFDDEAADSDGEDGLFDEDGSEDSAGDEFFFDDDDNNDPVSRSQSWSERLKQVPPDAWADEDDFEELAARYRKLSRLDRALEEARAHAPTVLWMIYSPVKQQAGNAARVDARLPEPCSAFAVDALPGRFYVQALDIATVRRACAPLRGLDRARVRCVPAEERSTVLGLRDGSDLASTGQRQRLRPGNWVTVRRGTYRGDSAIIREAHEGDALTLAVVPRIAPKDRESATGERAPPRLFDYEGISDSCDGEAVERLPGNRFGFRGHVYVDGLRVMTVPGLHAVTKATPSLDEVQLFALSGCDLGDLERGEPLLQFNDTVKVVAGTYVSLTGTVCSLEDETIWIKSVRKFLGEKVDGIIAVSRESVRRVLKAGANVRIRIGPLQGVCGLVIIVEDDMLTLHVVEEGAVKEIKVRSKWVETCDADAGAEAIVEIGNAREKPKLQPPPTSWSDPFAGLLVLVRNDKFAKGHYGYVLDSHPSKKTARVARDGTSNVDVVELAHLVSVNPVSCLDDLPLSVEEKEAYTAKFRELGMLGGPAHESQVGSASLLQEKKDPDTAATSADSGIVEVEANGAPDHASIPLLPLTDTSARGLWLLLPAVQARLATHRIHLRYSGVRYGFMTRAVSEPGGEHDMCFRERQHNSCRLTVLVSSGHSISRRYVFVRELSPRYPDKRGLAVMVVGGPVEGIGTLLVVLRFPRDGDEKVALVCSPNDRKTKWKMPLANLTMVDEVEDASGCK